MFDYWRAHPCARPADLVKECGVTTHAARSALTPKTVVNAHRMLHWAWEDQVTASGTAASAAMLARIVNAAVAPNTVTPLSSA